MGNNEIVFTRQEVESVLYTIKKLKVKGFKSMDAMVGTVMFLEGKIKKAQAGVMLKAQEAENSQEGIVEANETDQ